MQTELTQTKQQGRQAFDRGEYARALEIFDRILATHPGFADVRHSAGLCLVFLGRPEEALHQLDQALELNPAYVEAHVNRALVLQDLGRYEEARQAFEAAGAVEKHSSGRFPAAVTARLANAHMAVGDLYAEAGAPVEAASQYVLALELRPRFHDIRNKHAAVLLDMGRLDEAAVELRRVLELDPGFIAARVNLGLILHRQGQREGALAEWKACAEQQPDNPQVRAYLSMIEQVNAGTDAV
ncbi:MAG: tetratricopeptide repeat protein [Gemmatimonadota bacterium]